MRALAIVILLAAAGVLVFFASKTKAPESVPAAAVGDQAATSTAPAEGTDITSRVTLDAFNFTGYGPGKEHLGTFKETQLSGVKASAAGVPVAGRFVIKTASVSTGIDGLDKHLNSPDFFDTAKNPEIVFDLKSIAVAPTASSTHSVTGTLTFNSVTKEITFPATASADGKFSADFKFDTTFFAFKYVGIDRDVRIQFAGQIK